jgi:hypothetical protein
LFGLSIVSETSAHPGVGDDPVPLDEDHISIAKPRDHNAQVCGAANSLLREYVLAARPVRHTDSLPRLGLSVSDQACELKSLLGAFESGQFKNSPANVALYRSLMEENMKLRDENERLRANDEERIQLKAIVESVQLIAKIPDVSRKPE